MHGRCCAVTGGWGFLFLNTSYWPGGGGGGGYGNGQLSKALLLDTSIVQLSAVISSRWCSDNSHHSWLATNQ